jgi:hypothetical protein
MQIVKGLVWACREALTCSCCSISAHSIFIAQDAEHPVADKVIMKCKQRFSMLSKKALCRLKSVT